MDKETLKRLKEEHKALLEKFEIETKIASLVERLGVDKVLHFLVGFAFVLAGLMYGLGFSAPPLRMGMMVEHGERPSLQAAVLARWMSRPRIGHCARLAQRMRPYISGRLLTWNRCEQL